MQVNSGFIKKLLVYLIPIIILIGFVLILTSGSYLKQKLPAGIRVESSLLRLEELTSTKDWNEAMTQAEQLDQAWNEIAPWLQISSEDDDMKQFSTSVKRLTAYVQDQDAGASLAEIRSLQFFWDRLGM